MSHEWGFSSTWMLRHVNFSMNPRLIFSSGLTVWITRSQWPASSGSAKGAIRTNQWGHFSELLLRASYVQQHVGKPSNRPKKSKWVSHLESHPSVRGGRDLRKTLVFVSLTTQFSDLSVVYKTKVFVRELISKLINHCHRHPEIWSPTSNEIRSKNH